MSYAKVVQSLEELVESFLERVVAAKEHRLRVLEGIDRLDDIAGASGHESDLIDRVGEWFADHRAWLDGDGLRPGDLRYVGGLLDDIGRRLQVSSDESPAAAKIRSELGLWQRSLKEAAHRLVLKRGPESTALPTARRAPATFEQVLERLPVLFLEQLE